MADLLVPPPFMWACPRCAELLINIDIAAQFPEDSSFCDGLVRCHLMLAGHVARDHPAEIPGPHEDCPRCAFYEKQPECRGIDDLWAEHRARDLFLPAGVARLM